MSSPLIDLVQKPYLKPQTPEFRVGDTVDVHCRIVEGEKERIQVFNGVVIARKGRGVDESFTVRRIVNNEGVERKLLVAPVFAMNEIAESEQLASRDYTVAISREGEAPDRD